MHLLRLLTIITLITASAPAKTPLPTPPSHEGHWFLSHIQTPQELTPPDQKNKIVIAIVDDGIRTTHVDLKDFIWTNPAEVANNNIDDDGNDYPDDLHGWDISDHDNNANPPQGRSSTFYHGTHLAGIITKIVTQAYGPKASDRIQIMPVKCIEDQAQKTYIKDGYKGIAYAADTGADIIVCAWSVGHISAQEEQILQSAYHKGILVVASAGNWANENPQYPAGHNTVLAVGAIGQDDRKTERSNFGSFIDISAPGINITSSLANSDTAYGQKEGTSPATAMVAAAAVIIKLQNPDFTMTQVKACLINAATNIDSADPQYGARLGAGRLNIQGALDSQLFTRDTIAKNQMINPQGYLRLHNFKGNQAQWTIQPHGTFSGLTFKSISIKGNPANSTLSFYSDHTSGAKLIRQVSISAFPEKVFIPGTSAKVIYEPRDANAEFECLLEYRTKAVKFSNMYCRQWVRLEDEGTIEDGSGSEPYAINSDCKWLITAPPGKVIQFNFTAFDTEAKTDWLYFFDGAGTHEQIMAIYSGPNIPPPLTTWRNQVLLWFVTNNKTQNKGWKVNYQFIDPKPAKEN